MAVDCCTIWVVVLRDEQPSIPKAIHDDRLAYHLTDPRDPVPVAVVPAFVVPFLEVHRVLPRPKEAVDSGEDPVVVILS